MLGNKLRRSGAGNIRLVRGSHIVVRKFFDHDQPNIFQQPDGRIVFAIPYESDFCLVGTTDVDYEGDPGRIACTDSECDNLLAAINRYIDRRVRIDDIVWSFAGVRPLSYDCGADPASASRDYTLVVDDDGSLAPLLNVLGGKLTTYRRLAESALEKLSPYFPRMTGPWTADAPLPGGDFEIGDFDRLADEIGKKYYFLSDAWAHRLVRAYGTPALGIYGSSQKTDDIGKCFGSDLYELEVEWLVDNEWARTANDVAWRRSKLGLILNDAQLSALKDGIEQLLADRRIPSIAQQKANEYLSLSA